MKKVVIFGCLLGLFGASAWVGCAGSRAGYESAPYAVVRGDGAFQVRDYPALSVVETSMGAGGRDGGDGSFRRLFGFIAGGNDAKRKIAMTTPVFVAGGEAPATMAFVLPAGMKAGEIPRPADGAVTVREWPAGRFAVLRFGGGRAPAREAEAVARLRAWMAAQGLPERSPPVFAYFDPPWTPAFLRRNEVMLRTDGAR